LWTFLALERLGIDIGIGVATLILRAPLALEQLIVSIGISIATGFAFTEELIGKNTTVVHGCCE